MKKTTQPSRTRKLIELSSFGVWSLYFAAFIGGLSSSFYLPAALTISQEFQTTHDMMKLALTIYLAGVSLGSLFIGPLTDLWGVKRVYLVSFAIYTLTSLVCGFTSDIDVFNVARFFQGFSAVAGATLSLTVLAEHLTGTRYKKATYMLVALISLGPAIAPSLGGYLLDLLSDVHLVKDWRLLFVLLAIGSFLSMLSLYFYIPKDPASGKGFISSVSGDLKTLSTTMLFWMYCVIAGLAFGCFFLFLSMSPFVFEKYFMWTHLEYTWVGIGAALGMSGGSVFQRLFLADWTPRNTIDLGFGFAFLSSLLIILFSVFSESTGVIILVLASLILFGCGLVATTSIERAMDYAKGASDAASGFVISIKIGIAAIVTSFSTMISDNPIYLGILFTLILFGAIIINHLVHMKQGTH